MSSHQTIAKNSMFLYFRMFITMAVGLYTSRLVLEALGVVDYGLYGLVGGVVSMFSFLNSAMAAGTQRYLSFDIGKGDDQRLQQTFNASLNIHILIGFIIVLLAETIGLWFVNYKLDIPAERMTAANWVYQFSILAFFFNVIQVPYNALLIARERMSVYAYMSIVEVLLKLVIVFVLLAYEKDRLILYSILTFSISFTTRMLYQWYCRKHFKEARYQFYYDKNYYKELLNYSGWNLFGNIASVARNQGSNILLNLFFGPIVNAAYGLTAIVQGVIVQFVSNFQMAVNPQIVKNYAKGEVKQSIDLIIKSAKFSFYVMLLLIMPLLLNLEYILNIWLVEVPKYTVQFLKLALFFILIETISNPVMSGITATGKIKTYHVVISSVNILNLPISWVVFKITNNPINLYVIFLIISVILLFFRMWFLSYLMRVEIKNIFKNILLRIFVVFIPTFLLYHIFQSLNETTDFMYFLIKSIFITIIIGIIIWFLGINKEEKGFIIDLIRKKIK